MIINGINFSNIDYLKKRKNNKNVKRISANNKNFICH